jgi:hypothetical protein
MLRKVDGSFSSGLAGIVKKGVVAGLCTAGLFYGAQDGVYRYMKSLDEPELIARQEVVVERMSDGRIHIKQLTEKHEYFFIPQGYQAPQAKPEEKPVEPEKEEKKPDLPAPIPQTLNRPHEYGQLVWADGSYEAMPCLKRGAPISCEKIFGGKP